MGPGTLECRWWGQEARGQWGWGSQAVDSSKGEACQHTELAGELGEVKMLYCR